MQDFGKIEDGAAAIATYMEGRAKWTLKWRKKQKTDWSFNALTTPAQVVDRAVDWIKKNLPDELQPGKDRLAFVGCVRFGPNSNRWMWIVDFKINPEVASAGVFNGVSLPIGFTPAGEIITEFEEEKR